MAGFRTVASARRVDPRQKPKIVEPRATVFERRPVVTRIARLSPEILKRRGR